MCFDLYRSKCSTFLIENAIKMHLLVYNIKEIFCCSLTCLLIHIFIKVSKKLQRTKKIMNRLHVQVFLKQRNMTIQIPINKVSHDVNIHGACILRTCFLQHLRKLRVKKNLLSSGSKAIIVDIILCEEKYKILHGEGKLGTVKIEKKLQ